MTTEEAWNDETTIKSDTVVVPRWLDQEISPSTCMAISEGGCASGAYMPAVTYFEALKTMRDYGDEVFQYIDDALGEIPLPDADTAQLSWSGLAVFYLSTAVELWASAALVELAVNDG